MSLNKTPSQGRYLVKNLNFSMQKIKKTKKIRKMAIFYKKWSNFFVFWYFKIKPSAFWPLRIQLSPKQVSFLICFKKYIYFEEWRSVRGSGWRSKRSTRFLEKKLILFLVFIKKSIKVYVYIWHFSIFGF